MMSGVAAVQARIAAIESRFGVRPQVQATQSGVGTFDAMLQKSVSSQYDGGKGSTINSGSLSSQSIFPANHDHGHSHVHGTDATKSVPPAAKSHIPAEFIGYGNGKIPGFALQTIGQGNHKLWGSAAQAFKMMFSQAGLEGVTIPVTDSYRSYDEQVKLAAKKGIYGKGGLAAVPGTSNHGWGVALDLNVNDKATLNWLRENAGKFGFVENVPGEPWHWEYRPNEV